MNMQYAEAAFRTNGLDPMVVYATEVEERIEVYRSVWDKVKRILPFVQMIAVDVVFMVPLHHIYEGMGLM